jgi:hypothetical protein
MKGHLDRRNLPNVIALAIHTGLAMHLPRA